MARGRGDIDEHPAAAVLGALVFSGLGDAGAAETWAAAAERGGRREPASGYQRLALIGLALAHVLDGQPDAADPFLERAAVEALHLNRIPAAVVATSERGLLAAADGRWDDAERHADHAVGLVDEWKVEEYTESALAFALAARVAVRRGDAPAARAFLTRAAELEACHAADDRS